MTYLLIDLSALIVLVFISLCFYWKKGETYKLGKNKKTNNYHKFNISLVFSVTVVVTID